MHNKLKNKIENFNQNLNSKKLKEQFKKLEQQRLEFITKFFPVSNICNMKIDDYVLGKGEYTFCRYIEYRLKLLGDIRGATASKYGVYYGKRGADKTKGYRYNLNLGCSDYSSAFELIKNRIIELLREGESKNIEKINRIRISPMVRGKILYLYYPEKYLPVYSEADVDYFLEQLEIKEKGSNILEKQNKLIEWKNEDTITKAWSMLEFQRFLYNIFPNVKRDIINANQVADSILQEKIANEAFKDNEYAYIKNKEIKKKKKLVKVNGTLVYPRDSKVARSALINSNFECQFNVSHERFSRKTDGKPYTEAHHLVPLSEHYNFDVNLDQEANIVSLCCNCHAQIHKGKDSSNMIKKLYNLKKQELHNAGIDITEEELLKIYK